MPTADSSATSGPPCVLHEDEHMLVVNKPAGWNTHSPSPFAGEGVYDWLKHREPRWADLAIIHRLDKETSGVIVFGKTALANRSLTEQFASRKVRKKYVLLTQRVPSLRQLTIKSRIVRVGERYVSSPHGEEAETRFLVLSTNEAGLFLLEAQPVTGRTHQIRVHASEGGFPIIGDTLYGGMSSQRICLHAGFIAFHHPVGNREMVFTTPEDFSSNARIRLREAFIDPVLTDAFRLSHGASDGPQLRGRYVDRLGDYLLSATDFECGDFEGTPEFWMKKFGLRGVFHRTLTQHIRRTDLTTASPKLVCGTPSPGRFAVRENGVRFELSFNEGYSIGLFLDQRDNRRRFMTGHVAAGFPLVESEISCPKPEILNTFAYTCGFSVCAALAGWRTTSLDLSRKYLEWGERNFTLNGLDTAGHDFIYGDAFDWLRRLAKKGRTFDAVILDPPTFSQSKAHGVFRAGKDYRKLVSAALPVLKPGGLLFASTNAANLSPEEFLYHVDAAVAAARRRISLRHYVPQPPDFPISRAEPAYLKTVWLRVS